MNEITVWYQYKDVNGTQVITQSLESVPDQYKKHVKEVYLLTQDVPYILKYYDLWITCIFNTETLEFNTEEQIIDKIRNYQIKKLDEILYHQFLPTDWIVIKLQELQIHNETELFNWEKEKNKKILEERLRLRKISKELKELIMKQKSWKVLAYIGDNIKEILEGKITLDEIRQLVE